MRSSHMRKAASAGAEGDLSNCRAGELDNSLHGNDGDQGQAKPFSYLSDKRVEPFSCLSDKRVSL